MTQILGRGIQIFNGANTGGGGGGPITAAANGLSVENRAGVQTAVWGSAIPLDEPVVIDASGQGIVFNTVNASWDINDTQVESLVADGTNNASYQQSSVLFQFSVIGTGYQNVLEFGQSPSPGLFVDLSDTLLSNQAEIQIINDLAGGAQFFLNVIDNSISAEKHINGTLNSGTGIGIADQVDHIGLNGDELFPVNNPNQYAQYGNVISDPVTKFLADVVNGTGTLFSINTPATGETQYYFNFAAFSDTFSVGAVTQITLNYIDRVGNPQTVLLVNTITGAPESVVYSFIAAPNTSATLTYSVTDTGGGNTLTVSGQVSQQQNF